MSMQASGTLAPGIKGEYHAVVDETNSTAHIGSSAATLNSPAMIQFMELAALDGVQPHLPDGQTTVGFDFNIKHLAPTPLGKKVWAVAELSEVNGRKLTFKVEAFDEDKLIGAGTHRRAIVQISD